MNQRMRKYLETNDLLVHQQAGIRMFRSTEDQTTYMYLAEEIEDAFQEKKVTLIIRVDLQRAFDRLWTDDLLVKLQWTDVEGRKCKWLKSYLFNQRARVSLGSSPIRKFL